MKALMSLLLLCCLLSSSTFAQSVFGTPRTPLAANATYYVRNSGSDTNCTGLSNADDPGSGTIPRPCAFQTIQNAYNVIQNTLDLRGFNVTIQTANQTFTSGLAIGSSFLASGNQRPVVGAGDITLDLGGGTLSTTSADAIFVSGFVDRLTVQNGTLTTTTNGHAINVQMGGFVSLGSSLTFGPAAGNHVNAQYGGRVTSGSNYTITGGAQNHVYTDASGFVLYLFPTITLDGTPTFSSCFVQAQSAGQIHLGAVTFRGAAIGKRYCITGSGGVINFEASASPTYFPGNAAGTTVSGGQYDASLNISSQNARVTGDFSVTSSTTLMAVTGLSASLAGGRTYAFRAVLFCTDAAAGGVKASIDTSDTLTATDIIYDGYAMDNDAIVGSTRASALATTVASSATTGTMPRIEISGLITVNASGTLVVKFAQNTSNGTASVVKQGSHLLVTDVP